MKIALALLSAAVAVAATQHMHHGHHHLHEKRVAEPDATTELVPGPTEVVYVLNGQPISESEVLQGIANGTLIWAPDGQISAIPSSSSSLWSSTSTSTKTSTSTTPPPKPTTTSTSSTPPPPPPTTSSTSTSVAPAPSSAAPKIDIASTPSNSNSNSASGGSGVSAAFPDGQVDCSTFPSAYGPVAVDWLNLGGWTGIQNPGSSIGGFADIVTSTSGGCTEGSFCSYACPAGYQKSQWPATQGATGQSVGGILCQGGKLHLTNPSLSNNLCIPGASEVTVLVENNLSQNVAVCRTDYPGTESETVPLNAQPGTNTTLTTPDGSTYYFWEGKQTSAQYYVNPAGVAPSDACQWGSAANPWGNYAPLNIGAGYNPSTGLASLAIFPNLPTTSATLQFSVSIQGDGLSGPCSYSNGQYCSNTGCSAEGGCTVTAKAGSTAVFVFSN